MTSTNTTSLTEQVNGEFDHELLVETTTPVNQHKKPSGVVTCTNTTSLTEQVKGESNHELLVEPTRPVNQPKKSSKETQIPEKLNLYDVSTFREILLKTVTPRQERVISTKKAVVQQCSSH